MGERLPASKRKLTTHYRPLREFAAWAKLEPTVPQTDRTGFAGKAGARGADSQGAGRAHHSRQHVFSPRGSLMVLGNSANGPKLFKSSCALARSW